MPPIDDRPHGPGPVLQRQPRTGADLDFVTMGDLDREAGCDRMALAWVKREILCRNNIQAGSMLRRILRKR